MWVWTWTIGALIGLLIVHMALVESLANLWVLRAKGWNGARQTLEHGSIVEGILDLLILGVFLTLGIWALAPARIPEHLIPGGLVTAELLLVIRHLYGRIVDGRVRRHLEALAPESDSA